MSSTQPDFSAKRGDLICRPVHWMDIVRFLVFNFALHAVTVMSSPGEGAGRWISNRCIALFIPLVGTIGAVRRIYRYARGEHTPLAVALRAHALCMITPATQPLGMTHPSGILSESHLPTPNRTGYVTWVSRLTGGRRSSGAPDPQLPRTISLTVTTIQGQHPFEKPSYKEWAKSCFRTPSTSTSARLVTVPWNYTVTPLLSDRPDNFDLAYNYSAVKIIAAIAQILYGTFQLYQSSGPQITKAGYAAYQLALIPYIIMSLINLLASLCEPEFPAMFLVRQDPPPGDRPEEMSGEVGKASPPAVGGTLHSTRKNTHPITEYLLITLCVILILGSFIVPYLIIWWLTDFRVGRDPGTVAWEWSKLVNGEVPGLQLFNPWVVIWIAYGQLATVGMMRVGLASRTLDLRVLRWIYGLAAGIISFFGFASVIKLMAKDSICVVV